MCRHLRRKKNRFHRLQLYFFCMYFYVLTFALTVLSFRFTSPVRCFFFFPFSPNAWKLKQLFTIQSNVNIHSAPCDWLRPCEFYILQLTEHVSYRRRFLLFFRVYNGACVIRDLTAKGIHDGARFFFRVVTKITTPKVNDTVAQIHLHFHCREKHLFWLKLKRKCTSRRETKQSKGKKNRIVKMNQE